MDLRVGQRYSWAEAADRGQKRSAWLRGEPLCRRNDQRDECLVRTAGACGVNEVGARNADDLVRGVVDRQKPANRTMIPPTCRSHSA